MKNQPTAGRITGIFEAGSDANGIYEALRRRGYTSDEISVLMSEDTHKVHHHLPHENGDGTNLAGDAGEGALLGGVAGGVASALVAIAVPGIGLALAGPLLAGLIGATAGGVAGGAIGAAVGSWYPKEASEHYESSIKEGKVLVSLSPQSTDEHADLLEEFKKYHGQKIYINDDSVDSGYTVS